MISEGSATSKDSDCTASLSPSGSSSSLFLNLQEILHLETQNSERKPSFVSKNKVNRLKHGVDN
jgi:hypothetical protein